MKGTINEGQTIKTIWKGMNGRKGRKGRKGSVLPIYDLILDPTAPVGRRSYLYYTLENLLENDMNWK